MAVSALQAWPPPPPPPLPLRRARGNRTTGSGTAGGKRPIINKQAPTFYRQGHKVTYSSRAPKSPPVVQPKSKSKIAAMSPTDQLKYGQDLVQAGGLVMEQAQMVLED